MIGFNEIEYASHTDVGIRRSHNQDNHVVMPAADDEHWREVGHVFLVADGMGGHAVGELAAKIAVDNIPHIFSKYAHEGPLAALRRAFGEANLIIHTRGLQNREFKGMGTTGTAIVLRPEGAWVGHVGDSRAYRIRGGTIEQLSFDHSLLWEIARKQRKSPEELTGIQSNIISRSLGSMESVQVDVEGPHPLERGDIFLLCSDGLSGQVNDRVIGSVAAALPPDEAVQFLVHLANLQGGPDNTTVLVMRVGGEPKPGNLDSQMDVVFPEVENAQPIVPRIALMLYHASKLPWGFILLAAGILLAVVAIVLTTAESALLKEQALYAFIIAALSLLGGIVTLLIQNFRESRQIIGEPAEERTLQVYRKTACPLDAAIYERLHLSSTTLEESIRGKAWDYDVKTYQERMKQAAQLFKQGSFRDAFRAQCRAMLVLMEAVHRYRGKNEDFQPLWDRPRS
ncbi:MAG: protein phosphatase 2C domain-containing protein [Planctomycetes bacterium]|nr:protein phosphatase 2C domain-containing protein [Planctomycetota bacterium]